MADQTAIHLDRKWHLMVGVKIMENEFLVEDLFIYSHVNDIDNIANHLYDSLREGIFAGSDITLSINSPADDEMGVRRAWDCIYGGKVDDSSHVMSHIQYRIRIEDEDYDLESLGLRIYSDIRQIVKGYSGVEYFSMFGQEEIDD